jgi:hypothetical protein
MVQVVKAREINVDIVGVAIERRIEQHQAPGQPVLRQGECEAGRLACPGHDVESAVSC